MDDFANPYTPGAGTRPRELAGRGPELKAFDLLLRRLEGGKTEKSLVLKGLRGVGKTVLMSEFEDRAVERGWGVGKLEAKRTTDFRSEMAAMTRQALRQISAKARARDGLMRVAQFLQGFTVGANPETGKLDASFDLEAALAEPAGSDIERDLIELFVGVGKAAAENGTGVVFLIDEMQLLPTGDLEALCAAMHRATQKSLPVAVIGAGLPVLPEQLAEAKSYAERLFAYPDLGRLAESAARRAVERPAAVAIPDHPVVYETDAVDALLRYSGRYPYFLQAFGKHAWNLAPEGDVISLADVAAAQADARIELDRDFFETRFARATPAGRRYLAAMAEQGEGPYSTAKVAEVGGWKQISSAGPVRQTLIDKGLVWSPDHSWIEFTVPDFADFMRRNHPLASLAPSSP